MFRYKSPILVLHYFGRFAKRKKKRREIYGHDHIIVLQIDFESFIVFYILKFICVIFKIRDTEEIYAICDIDSFNFCHINVSLLGSRINWVFRQTNFISRSPRSFRWPRYCYCFASVVVRQQLNVLNFLINTISIVWLFFKSCTFMKHTLDKLEISCKFQYCYTPGY